MSNLVASHLPCEDCGSSDALSRYEDNTFCFSCSTSRFVETRESMIFPDEYHFEVQKEFALPADFTYELPEKAKAWFYKYRVYEPMEYLGAGWSPQLNRVILPVMDTVDSENIRLIAYQARDLTGKSDQKYLTFKNPEYTGRPRFFWPEYSNDQTIVVEDILSAFRVGRVAGPTVSLLGTSLDDGLKLYLALNKRVIIWLDGDDPGLEAAQRLHAKLSLHTQVKIIYTAKDPKEYSDEEIKQILGVNDDKRSDSATSNEKTRSL